MVHSQKHDRKGVRDQLKSPFQRKELPVLITVDVCDGSFDQGERKQRFHALMELMPAIRDMLLQVIGDRSGNVLPVTWFVRADMHVKEITGNAMGLFHGWRDFWDDVRSRGGEAAWHPHLYKPHGRKWVPIRDPRRLKSAADRIWHEIAGEQWKPLTSRMGESVGSSELMSFLDSIEIIADASALPGRRRDDGLRWFDWEGTPDRPYHPARVDYRRPSKATAGGDRVEGEKPLGILEIPFTMAPIRAPYDRTDALKNLRRYIDLSYDSDILRKGIAGIFRVTDYVVVVLHPMQTVGKEVPEGGLVVGGLDTVSRNLGTIIGTIRDANRTPKLMTMEEFARAWLGTERTGEAEETDDGKSAEKREQRDQRAKGGTQRTRIETEKAARLSTKGGVRAENRRPPRGPRKRRG